MRRECTRLTDGFLTYIKQSGGEVRRAIKEISALISVPDWQKSQCWIQEMLSPKCRCCEREFGMFLRKNSCRVCGMAVCSNCSNKDLIVYLPDDVDTSCVHEDDDVTAKLSIIKVIGCPDQEPSLCLYLRVCIGCQQKLSDIQVTSHLTCDLSHPLLSKVVDRHEHVMDIRARIESHLVDYQTIIDSLDDNSQTSLSQTGSSRCNMKILAKAQTNLSDFFTQYIMCVQHLKQLKPLVNSRSQSNLLDHFIQSVCDFYMNNMSIFRSHQHALEDTCHPETLRMIQRIMDRDAIVSAHVYLRQLVYEVLLLTSKHKILLSLPDKLVPVESEVEEEARACIISESEDWVKHQELMQQLVHSQIQNHRLIRPSRRQTKHLGAAHVEELTLARTLDVLLQVRLQLSIKTAHKHFPASKAALVAAFGDVEVFTREGT